MHPRKSEERAEGILKQKGRKKPEGWKFLKNNRQIIQQMNYPVHESCWKRREGEKTCGARGETRYQRKNTTDLPGWKSYQVAEKMHEKDLSKGSQRLRQNSQTPRIKESFYNFWRVQGEKKVEIKTASYRPTSTTLEVGRLLTNVFEALKENLC